MSRRPPRLVLAAWLAVAASPLLAAPSPRTATPRAPDSSRTTAASAAPVAQLWSHLTRLWSAIGCGIDPGVKCPPGTIDAPAVKPTPSSDIGAIADPDG